MEESFMLLSLKEKKSKKLAQVISNETSRDILNFLAAKEFATESTIAKELSIPLSTVHYNVQALKEAGLLLDDEYHYSEKGKEVPHYKLAKKFIIIAPKDEAGLMEKLRKFFPVALVMMAASVIIHLFQRLLSPAISVSQEMAFKAAPVADDALLMRSALEDTSASVPPETLYHSPVALWFLGGALFCLVIVMLVEFVRSKK